MPTAKEEAPPPNFASGERGKTLSRGQVVRSPGWRGVNQIWKSQHDKATSCANVPAVRTAVLLDMAGGMCGWVGYGWVGIQFLSSPLVLQRATVNGKNVRVLISIIKGKYYGESQKQVYLRVCLLSDLYIL